MSLRLVVEADGGSRGNPGPAGYGAVVRDAATGRLLAERAAGIGTATNNVAEYEGLIAGLTAAAELGPDEVEVRMDSKLVVEQMSGRWQVKHPSMRPLARRAADLVAGLGSVRFTWIPRERNTHADRLANAAMDAAARGLVWAPDAADEWLAAHDAPQPVEAPVGRAARTPNRLSGWMDPGEPPLTTLLLRHGQTPLSVERRFSGTGEAALTETGRAQVERAAERLAEMRADVVVSSPLRRAMETARTVAARGGLDLQVDDDLRETDFGAWEGRSFAEVRAEWPAELDAWLAHTDVPPPSGESFQDTARRVRSALARLRLAHAGRRVVVVSHVTPIKTLLVTALEAPLTSLYRMHLDLACLSQVDWHADGPAVVRSLNDTAHLEGLSEAVPGGGRRDRVTADESAGRSRQFAVEESPGSTGQGDR